MFRELLNLFGKQEGFGQIHDTFMRAFRTACEIFGAAHEALWSDDTSEETADRIYRRDIEINQAERAVRKAIVRHLSVQQGLDILFCLRIMSLVKDVERIGDYAKNLLEVGGFRSGEFDDVPLRERLRGLGDRTSAFLDEAASIFEASDEAKARAAVERGRQMTQDAETLVAEAVAHDGSANTAACFALAARHYKRAIGHGVNVLTGLTMPVHKLDYYDEDERR